MTSPSDVHANPDFRESADELLTALWTRYTNAAELFHVEPTPARWLCLKTAHTAWRVAVMVEGQGHEPSN